LHQPRKTDILDRAIFKKMARNTQETFAE